MDLNQEQETSAAAWLTLADLLDGCPVAVVWHNGGGCVREDFDVILERKGDVITSRTYQQGKVTSDGGNRVIPGRLCWIDTWTRERSEVARFPYLDDMLDRIQVQQQKVLTT